MRTARPPKLHSGDVVAVVAPAGPVREPDLDRGLAMLASRYTVRLDPRARARRGHLAGTDRERIVALQEAIDDPEVRAIVAARGGYGTSRAIDYVDLAPLRTHPKAFVGSSDLTVLGCALTRFGVGSIHGPMVESLGRALTEEVFSRLVRLLEDPTPPDDSEVPLTVLHAGRAVGPLEGGNLAVLASLVGTGTLPDLQGSILFIEDIGERPYRIDRMLTQLLRAGLLDGLLGVLVGDFVECEPKRDEPPPMEVIFERLSPLGIPILAGYPAAHGARFLALPVGALVELDGSRGRIRWVEGAVE